MFALPTLIATMVFWSSTAAAQPVPAHRIPRMESPVVLMGETPLNRTIVVAFCLSYCFLIALSLGEDLRKALPAD
jgi:hypothetical protein